ncbi:MAG TPA: hydantoinase/oxoprolinase family protein [Solirubrobacteraceae bacterium]
MSSTIDVDIGGTFTDCYVTHGRERVWCKTRTTTYDLSVGMNETIEEAAGRLGITTEELLADAAIIRYSTTLAMNRLIEHKGPKLGLLITEGFEDTTLIGRASQWSDGVPLKYQRNIAGVDRPEPLVPKELIVGVRERVDSRGEIVRPLDERDLLAKLQYLVDAGVRGFVVSLLWSFLDPAHERRIKEIIEEEYHAAFLGAMPVFLSSEVAPRIYEYPRTMMTILNAYLHQSMYEELSGIGDELRDRGYRRPMMMIHNTGGMASVLRTSAVNTYNGGPVAGLMGSAYIGGVYGYSNVVATDMGGTSFDIGMVAAGSPRFYQFMPIIDRWVVDATIVDCHSIGAGGGSIAGVNELIANRVEVGPESAGSMPGPAAYNQGGTQPTVTDADVVLGYVNPDNFHGGRIRLNPRRAERALRDHIAEPLGVSVNDAALMVRRIVDANMGQAIRRETVLKGFDPREFILFAFGGAGPTHCCGYARFAEMEKIVVFPFAPTFCAFGSSTMDVVHVYERSHHLHVLHPATGMYLDDYGSFNETVRGLREEALRDFAGEGYDPAEVTYELELDMKFGGQLNVKRVSSPLLELSTNADVVALRHAFEREYGDAYSPLGLNPEAGIEIHNFVLRGRVAQRRPELERHEFVSEDPSPALVSTREAHWEDLGTVPTPVYSQELIRCGNAIDGPAIIEAEDTTVVIEPGWRYTLDSYLNGVMERRHGGANARPMAALAEATPD